MKLVPNFVPALIALSFVACGKPEKATPDSLAIAQTAVENQLRVGFCWAYASLGLVESDTKMRTGKVLDLSEEALGFYRMAEGLYQLTKAGLPRATLKQRIDSESLEGWYLKSNFGALDAFALIEKYGLVPESVWNVKFETAAETRGVTEAIKAAMKALVDSKEDIGIEDIISQVLLAPGAWPSRPPTEFAIEGTRYTSHGYLRTTGFKPGAYRSVVVSQPSDVEALIAATKRSLVRGVSVALAYPINFDRLKGDTFSGKNVDLNNAKNFHREGYHAVLINDFVNKGGKPGAIALADLVKEFLRPTKYLDYFVFKNSWGANATTNEAGRLVSGSSSGYYKIDREYLVGASNMTLDKRYYGPVSVVVPADIASDPFGSEDVNPQVAAK